MRFLILFVFYGLVTKKNYITHLNVPICKDCVHYKNHYLVGNYEHGKCSLFGKKDFVTGVIKYEYADFCRYSNNKCGENALHFEENKYKFQL